MPVESNQHPASLHCGYHIINLTCLRHPQPGVPDTFNQVTQVSKSWMSSPESWRLVLELWKSSKKGGLERHMDQILLVVPAVPKLAKFASLLKTGLAWKFEKKKRTANLDVAPEGGVLVELSVALRASDHHIGCTIIHRRSVRIIII